MKKISHVFALIAASVALTGCVSTKYKLTKNADAAPPIALNLSSTTASVGVDVAPPVEVTLHTVIVFQGPGSWKREAYWDEYVLGIANRGDVPLSVESATLVDFQGNANGPGDNPWKLDDESKTAWQRFKSGGGGYLLALGAYTVAVSGGIVATAASSGALAFLGSTTAAGAAAGFTAGALLIVAPIYAVSIKVINSKNKKHVLAEFDHRRLALPCTIAPGKIVQGSLFFRISPGPQRLVLRYRVGSEPREATIDLAPLASLHLKAAPAAAPAISTQTNPPKIP